MTTPPESSLDDVPRDDVPHVINIEMDDVRDGLLARPHATRSGADTPTGSAAATGSDAGGLHATVQRAIVRQAATYDHHMKLGSKPIMHLEAFTANVMMAQKQYLASR